MYVPAEEDEDGDVDGDEGHEEILVEFHPNHFVGFPVGVP